MTALLRKLADAPQAGLAGVILTLCIVLTLCAGTREDRATGQQVNTFLNADNLVQMTVRPAVFAVMAVGMTMVIVSGGIDLSVGSVYALAAVGTALLLRALNTPDTSGAAPPGWFLFGAGLLASLAIGLACGLANGLLVVGLGVHPFIITMGTMLIFRGAAAVVSRSESVSVPDALVAVAKAPLGLPPSLHPVPGLLAIAVAAAGALYLSHTVPGRHLYAVGGNPEAARFAGLPVKRIVAGVYVFAGLAAGLAAFLATSYYGAANSGDAMGYELFVIAAAVVGGASLNGGKGGAIGALLGALLLELIRKSITTLRIDQNYEWIVVGAAIIVAVVLDQASAKWTARRLARQAAPAGKTGGKQG